MLFVTGLLSLLGIIVLFRSPSLSIPRRTLTSVLFMLPPIGIILVSLFPENTILAVHMFGAFMVFTFGGILDVYAYRFTTPPFRYFSVLLGAISFGATFLLGGSLIAFGIAERLVVYPLILWYISFGGYLMSR